MTIPQITPLPAAPQRSDNAEDFSNKADAFVAALVSFVTEMNATAGGINSLDTIGGQVKTYAELKALSKSLFNDRSMIRVGGDAYVGDGKGGIYYYDAADTTTSETVDGSVIVATDGARWKRILGFAQIASAITNAISTDGSGRDIPDPKNLVNFLPNATKPHPPGMSWLPFDVLGMRADGKVAISKTGQQILDAIVTLPNASATYGYLDAAVGDDADVGGIQQPWLTLSKAVSQGAYITKIAVGDYVPFVKMDRTLTSGNRVRRFYGSGNPREMKELDPTRQTIIRATGDDLSAATWSISASPACNQATLSTSNIVVAVVHKGIRDEFGRPLPLTKQTSAANVAANGGWYYDTGTKILSVRYGKTANFDAGVKPQLEAIYYDAATTGYVKFEGAEAYFENCLFVGCFPHAYLSAANRAKVIFKNCGFWFSRVSGVINQGSDIVLIDCEIYRCQQDGVNSHLSGAEEATHILVNTDMNYCGDYDTVGNTGAENQNGASIHEDGLAAVLGGNIKKSSGPGLIDTGPGAGGIGVSWWLGVHVEDSLAAASNSNFDLYGERTVWMDACSETGDASDPVPVRDSNTVLRYGSNAVRGYTPSTGGSVGGEGQAVAYDPAAPG